MNPSDPEDHLVDPEDHLVEPEDRIGNPEADKKWNKWAHSRHFSIAFTKKSKSVVKCPKIQNKLYRIMIFFQNFQRTKN